MWIWCISLHPVLLGSSEDRTEKEQVVRLHWILSYCLLKHTHDPPPHTHTWSPKERKDSTEKNHLSLLRIKRHTKPAHPPVPCFTGCIRVGYYKNAQTKCPPRSHPLTLWDLAVQTILSQAASSRARGEKKIDIWGWKPHSSEAIMIAFGIVNLQWVNKYLTLVIAH